MVPRKSGGWYVVVEVREIASVKCKLHEIQRSLCQVKNSFFYVWSLLTLIKPEHFPVDQK